MAMLDDDQIAALRTMQEGLQETRPAPRTAERHAHDALYDALSGVIAVGGGIMTAGRDFRDAAKSMDKSVKAA